KYAGQLEDPARRSRHSSTAKEFCEPGDQRLGTISFLERSYRFEVQLFSLGWSFGLFRPDHPVQPKSDLKSDRLLSRREIGLDLGLCDRPIFYISRRCGFNRSDRSLRRPGNAWRHQI